MFPLHKLCAIETETKSETTQTESRGGNKEKDTSHRFPGFYVPVASQGTPKRHRGQVTVRWV